MWLFLCLFNLDGMFHLQAAITAGCLIVWVRLMAACSSVLISVHFSLRSPISLHAQFLSLSLFPCTRADIFLIQLNIVCLHEQHASSHTHSRTKPLAWLLMMTYEFLALVMAVKSHNYTILYCNA